MNVLVVDDAPEIRKRLVAMLRTIPGVAVAGEAESVHAAIDNVLTSAVDVVLLDLQLIDGSGLQVLAAVRAQRPEVRVIVLSNFANTQYREAAMRAGAELFLDKSSEFRRVPEVLRGWLRSSDAVAP